MNNKYLILPGCDDSNRGDQALIWETMRLAEDAGYRGEYYMLGSKTNSEQSIKRNIQSITPILKHPSRKFEDRDNTKYSKTIKIKWGIVAILDLIYSLLLFVPLLSNIVYALSDNEIKESINIFKKADSAFVKGGGFIHSNGSLVDSYKIYYFLFHIYYALYLKKKVYIMPNSFGPFDGLLVKWMIKKALNRCEIVTTRESISQKTLKNECNIRAYNYPDMAFYLEPDTDKDIEALLQKQHIPYDTKKCVALTMRPNRFENGNTAYNKYTLSLAEFIIWLANHEYYPVLVEHTHCDLKNESDMSCIEDVCSILNNKVNYSVFTDKSLNCKELKKVYSYFQYIVGTRFHSVIFSVAQNVPAIAITYGGNKGNGIMNDMGLSDYAINIDEVTADRLIGIFSRLNSEQIIIKERINTYLSYVVAKRDELIRMIRRD